MTEPQTCAMLCSMLCYALCWQNTYFEKMFCSQCGKLLSKIDGFCGSCGATSQSCRESLPLKYFTAERDAITEYFTAGYSLSSIESFLTIYHNINISKRTLKRRLKKYGLRRRLAPDNNSVVTAGPRRFTFWRFTFHHITFDHITFHSFNLLAFHLPFD